MKRLTRGVRCRVASVRCQVPGVRSRWPLVTSAVLVMLLAAASAVAGSQTRANASSPLLWWPANSTTYYSFVPGTIAPNNDNDLVQAAVRSALTTLMKELPQQNGKPVVQFLPASSSSGVNRVACDGVNLVTFTDNDITDRLDPVIVAQATMWSSPFSQTGVLDCAGRLVNLGAGQIYEVDMNFNAGLAFTTNRIERDAQGNPLVFDIQSVATHEGGHWLGLGHSGISSAVMSPYGDSGNFPVRALHSDDLASLRAIYGPDGPSISGSVTLSGAPVKGAHVVATNTATGLTTASATPEPASATPQPTFTFTGGDELTCRVLSQSRTNGSHFSPKETFEIGWKVRNTGTLDWDPSSVDFAYYAGTKMYVYSPVPLPATVVAGDEIALGASMVAPRNSGSYTTVWTLRRGGNDFCHVTIRINVP